MFGPHPPAVYEGRPIIRKIAYQRTGLFYTFKAACLKQLVLNVGLFKVRRKFILSIELCKDTLVDMFPFFTIK